MARVRVDAVTLAALPPLDMAQVLADVAMLVAPPPPGTAILMDAGSPPPVMDQALVAVAMLVVNPLPVTAPALVDAAMLAVTLKLAVTGPALAVVATPEWQRGATATRALVVVAMIDLQSIKTSYISIYFENNSYSLS